MIVQPRGVQWQSRHDEKHSGRRNLRLVGDHSTHMDSMMNMTTQTADQPTPTFMIIGLQVQAFTNSSDQPPRKPRIRESVFQRRLPCSRPISDCQSVTGSFVRHLAPPLTRGLPSQGRTCCQGQNGMSATRRRELSTLPFWFALTCEASLF